MRISVYVGSGCVSVVGLGEAVGLVMAVDLRGSARVAFIHRKANRRPFRFISVCV